MKLKIASMLIRLFESDLLQGRAFTRFIHLIDRQTATNISGINLKMLVSLSVLFQECLFILYLIHQELIQLETFQVNTIWSVLIGRNFLASLLYLHDVCITTIERVLFTFETSIRNWAMNLWPWLQLLIRRCLCDIGVSRLSCPILIDTMLHIRIEACVMVDVAIVHCGLLPTLGHILAFYG